MRDVALGRAAMRRPLAHVLVDVFDGMARVYTIANLVPIRLTAPDPCLSELGMLLCCTAADKVRAQGDQSGNREQGGWGDSTFVDVDACRCLC